MKKNHFPSLRGTGVALVTPFQNGRVDFDAYARVMEHTLAGGVDYWVVLGSTGEAITLSEKEQDAVIRFAVKTARGRLPVVVGIFGGSNTAQLVERMQSFDFQGIDALLCSSPAYNKPSQEGIYQHYLALAEASPLPIVIYNVPARTASNITAETTLRLAHANPKFAAVKEAGADLLQMMQIMAGSPPDFLLLSGDDFLTLPILAAGGQGVISVMANTTPRPFCRMVKAAMAGDLITARQLNADLLDLYRLLFVEGNPVGVKAALELQGLCSREVRLPLTSMSEAGVGKIKAAMERLENAGDSAR
jgi:4-hydroxy-tetrahydrodipicolinate synthase